MQEFQFLEPPELEIDKILNWAEKPLAMRLRHLNEQTILWSLIAFMRGRGFSLVGIFDGEEYVKTSVPQEVMELAFNVDECRVRFQKDAKCHPVVFIWDNGNHGLDAISDWGYSDGDPDGFNAAMEAFLDLLEKEFA